MSRGRKRSRPQDDQHQDNREASTQPLRKRRKQERNAFPNSNSFVPDGRGIYSGMIVFHAVMLWALIRVSIIICLKHAKQTVMFAKVICPGCGNSYTNNIAELTRHAYAHLPEKWRPYLCSFSKNPEERCTRRFAQPSQCQTHECDHYEKKNRPVPDELLTHCDRIENGVPCAKKAKDPSTISRHKANYHSTSTEKRERSRVQTKDPQTISLHDYMENGGWRAAFSGNIQDGFGPRGLGDEESVAVDLAVIADLIVRPENASVNGEPAVPSGGVVDMTKMAAADALLDLRYGDASPISLDISVFSTHAASGHPSPSSSSFDFDRMHSTPPTSVGEFDEPSEPRPPCEEAREGLGRLETSQFRLHRPALFRQPSISSFASPQTTLSIVPDTPSLHPPPSAPVNSVPLRRSARLLRARTDTATGSAMPPPPPYTFTQSQRRPSREASPPATDVGRKPSGETLDHRESSSSTASQASSSNQVVEAPPAAPSRWPTSHEDLSPRWGSVVAMRSHGRSVYEPGKGYTGHFAHYGDALSSQEARLLGYVSRPATRPLSPAPLPTHGRAPTPPWGQVQHGDVQHAMDILNEGLDPALEERLMADEARVSDMPQLQKRYIPRTVCTAPMRRGS